MASACSTIMKAAITAMVVCSGVPHSAAMRGEFRWSKVHGGWLQREFECCCRTNIVVSNQPVLAGVYFFAFERLKGGGADERECDKAEKLLEKQGAVGSLDKQGPRGGVQSPPQSLRAKCLPARQ